MDAELHVFMELDGAPREVGRLWTRARGAKETASFEYATAWLDDRRAFQIDPELPLSRGQFHTQRPLFNAFADPAPDRWGQNLLRRAERLRAVKERRQPRTLMAVDFLTLVQDETRLGALRFRRPGATEFLASSEPAIPPLIELPRLLAAASRIVADRESEDDLRLLLAPGTSLGGARPKASVRERDGSLSIAKFPRKDDEWPLTSWEFVTLQLANEAGLVTAEHRLVTVLRREVLVVRRFDRDGGRRVPFISGLTALGATDGENRTYRELAVFIREQGARVDEELEELFRRILFNILVSNTDDHLRNHGLLWSGRGWRLSPAYDLNPVPADVRPRLARALSVDAGAENTAEGAIAVATRFGVSETRARRIARQVGGAVSAWRKTGKRAGLTAKQLDRMASAFDHDDLRFALGRR